MLARGRRRACCKDCSCLHHLSSRSLRTRVAAGLSLTATAGSWARSCLADGTIRAVAPLPWSYRSAMTALCMREGHFQAPRHFKGQAHHGMHVCDWLIQDNTAQASFAVHVRSCHAAAQGVVPCYQVSLTQAG